MWPVRTSTRRACSEWDTGSAVRLVVAVKCGVLNPVSFTSWSDLVTDWHPEGGSLHRHLWPGRFSAAQRASRIWWGNRKWKKQKDYSQKVSRFVLGFDTSVVVFCCKIMKSTSSLTCSDGPEGGDVVWDERSAASSSSGPVLAFCLPVQALTQPSFHALSTIQFSERKRIPIPNHQCCPDSRPVCINSQDFPLKNTVKVLCLFYIHTVLCMLPWWE